MSVYCRAIVVNKVTEEDSRVLCACGWERTGTHQRARRAYYQHNPDSQPIPMPEFTKTAIEDERPVMAEDVVALLVDLQATRAESLRMRGRTWPDARENQISRCAACGTWQWDKHCPVVGCWSVTGVRAAA